MARSIRFTIVVCLLLVVSLSTIALAEERVWFTFFMGNPTALQGKVIDSTRPTDGWIYKVYVGESEDSLVEMCSFHYDVISVDGIIEKFAFGDKVYDTLTWIPVAVDITQWADKPFILRLEVHMGNNAQFDWAKWGNARIIRGELPALTEVAVDRDDILEKALGLPEGIEEVVLLAHIRHIMRCTRFHIVDGKKVDLNPIGYLDIRTQQNIYGQKLAAIYTHPPRPEDFETTSKDMRTVVQWTIDISGGSASVSP